ncbi:MAG: Hsp20/alpha crystallin family protein [Dehalococcoidia bacterium]
MVTNGKQQLTVRRTPTADLDDLREALRSVFDMRWPFASLRPVAMAEGRPPAVDVFERDGNVVVQAEMPGMKPEKIDVTVVEGELRISGERSEEKEVREEHYYRSERSFGRIYRAIALPEGCDTEHIRANSKDGVLEVVIPKKQTATPKKVAVTGA